MALPKGKAPTKGAKQIVEENRSTLRFYLIMSLAAATFYIIWTIVVHSGENLSAYIYFQNLLVLLLYVGSYQFMKHMSKPTYTENNQLIDPGNDLNMEGGMGEHVKDIIILNSITHVLAALSNYFWFLLLLLPLRAAMLVWTNFLGPWFFQEGPQETEQDEKKRMKMERKMKRLQR